MHNAHQMRKNGNKETKTKKNVTNSNETNTKQNNKPKFINFSGFTQKNKIKKKNFICQSKQNCNKMMIHNQNKHSNTYGIAD